jgi:hypothetical protein
MTPEQAEALAAMDRSKPRYERAAKAMKEASDQALGDALAALRAGVKPAEVGRHSPFTDSYLRRLARDNGIEPDPRYVRT